MLRIRVHSILRSCVLVALLSLLALPAASHAQVQSTSSASQPSFIVGESAYPIREPVAQHQDKYWLQVVYPPGNADKVAIRVSVEAGDSSMNPAGIERAVKSALASTGRFRAVEGRPARGRGSAAIEIKVSVVQHDATAKRGSFGGFASGLIGQAAGGIVGSSAGSLAGGIASDAVAGGVASIGTRDAEFGIAVQVIDAGSGDILDSFVAKARTSAKSAAASSGGSAEVAGWINPAMAAAARIAANKTAYHLWRSSPAPRVAGIHQ